MPIATSNMRLYFSGGASKSTPDGNQGGTISSLALPDQDFHSSSLVSQSMWKNVTYAERTNGSKKYHCFYLKNSDPSLTATGIKLWIDAYTTGPDKVKLGYAGTLPNVLEQAIGASSIKAQYDVPLNSSEARMDNDRTRAGQSIDSTRAGLYGIAPVRIDAWLIRHGAANDNSPVKCFVKDTGGGSIKASFGQVTASTIPTTSTLTTFQNLSNTYKLKVDDIIWFEYTSGTSNDYVAVNRIGTDPVAYSHQMNFDGQQIRNVSDFDLSMKVYSSTTLGGVDTTAPTGVTFGSPNTRETAISLPDLAPGAFVGFWEMLEVPVRTAYFTGSKSEITIEYNSP